MKQPATAMEALNTDLWIRRESSRLNKMGETMGSPLEKTTIQRWRRDNPTVIAELDRKKLTEPLAHVLIEKMLEAQRENLKAGMPLTDAREQAERDWLDLEPEAATAEA